MTGIDRIRAGAVCTLVLAIAGVAEGAPKKKKSKRERAQERAALRVKQTRIKASHYWVEVLTRPQPLQRFYASWNLQALAPESVDVVLRTIAAREVKVEVLAGLAEVLGELRSPRGLPALRTLISDLTLPAEVRLTALVSAARFLTGPSRALLREVAEGKLKGTVPAAARRKRRAPAAHATAGEATPALQRVALIALGMIGDAGARPAIESALKATDAETRRAAYRAIGYLKDRRFLPDLNRGLADPNPLVRAQAGNALGKTGDVRTADVIAKRVARLPRGAERFLLVDALAWAGRQGAIQELLRHAQNRRSPVQSTAATILFEIAAPQALPVFRKLLAEAIRGVHSEGVDQIVAFALGALGDQAAIPVLIKALTKGSAATQREAAASLGRLKAKAAVPALLKAVRKGHVRLRADALIALGKIGAPEAAAPLKVAIKDRDPAVRWGAAVALEKLGQPRGVRLLRPLLRDAHPFVARAAEEASAVLQGQPRVKTDARSANALVRLRSLEREYLFRLRYAGLFSLLTRVATPAPSKERVVKPAEYRTVGWESYWSTCGGSHPPIEYRRPIREKVSEEIRERNPEYDRWAETQARNQAASDEIKRQQEEELERIYRLKGLKGEAKELLESTDGVAKPAAGKKAP